jgi:hypothetical protein
MYRDNALEKVYEFRDAVNKEVIALQPGKYTVIYRSKFDDTMHSTRQQEFEISSGEQRTLSF